MYIWNFTFSVYVVNAVNFHQVKSDPRILSSTDWPWQNCTIITIGRPLEISCYTKYICRHIWMRANLVLFFYWEFSALSSFCLPTTFYPQGQKPATVLNLYFILSLPLSLCLLNPFPEVTLINESEATIDRFRYPFQTALFSKHWVTSDGHMKTIGSCPGWVTR